MRGKGYLTVTLDEKPEAYVVASTAFGHIAEVIDRYDPTAWGATAALAQRDALREQDIRESRAGKRTLEVLAVRHDCDENPVPYVSDGPLGHGWECGVCGAFLQAG